MVNLINSQRSNFSPSQSVASLYILFTFDPLSNMFQHELFKSLNDPIQLYTFYDNQLTGIINNSIARQQRETNGFSITNIMNDLLNILPPVGQVGIK